MLRYYIQYDKLDPVGPYPTEKMAQFMKGTYDTMLKLEGYVVAIKDKKDD